MRASFEHRFHGAGRFCPPSESCPGGGSGVGGGVLGLLLCGRYSDCTVTGVELCQQAHQAALENIDRNGLGRLRSVLGDLRQVRTILPGGAFSCAVSNPPYFLADSLLLGGGVPGPAGKRLHPFSDVYQAASWLLRFGGDFFCWFTGRSAWPISWLWAVNGTWSPSCSWCATNPLPRPAWSCCSAVRGQSQDYACYRISFYSTLTVPPHPDTGKSTT